MSRAKTASVRATRRLAALSFVVWVCLLTLCVPLAGAQAATDLTITLDPALPAVDVQFLATPSVPYGTKLFISWSSTECAPISTTCIVGDSSSEAYFSPTTCKFIVTNKVVADDKITSNPVPTLYWCAKTPSGTAWQTAPLHVNRIMPSPAYVLQGVTSTTLYFNEATPVNTRVLIQSGSSNCPKDNKQNYRTLDATRSYSLQIGKNDYTWYVCASVPIVQGGTVVSYTGIKALSVVVTQVERKDIDVTTGYTNGQIAVAVYGEPNKGVALSSSEACTTFVQDVQYTRGTELTLNLYAPHGVYFFCVESDGSGVYVPANQKFTVYEYQMLPQIVYTRPTSMSVTVLGSSTVPTPAMQMLFIAADEECSNYDNSDEWKPVGAQWTAPRMGTFNACVRQVNGQRAIEGTTARATTVTSYNTPQLVIPAGALYGFPTTLQLSDVVGSTSVTAGLALDDSCKVLSKATINIPSTATTASVTLTIPYDVQETTPRYSVCLSPPSSSTGGSDATPFFYSFTTMQPWHYNFSYAPLFAQTRLNLGLNTRITLDANSVLKFMPPTSTCNDAPGADNNNCFVVTSSMSTLSGALFPSTGGWKACLHAAGDGATCTSPASTTSFTQIATLTVYGTAQFTPSSALVDLPSTMTVTQLQPQATVTVSASPSCPAPSSLATAQADKTGTATLTLPTSKAGTLTVCSTYRGQADGQPTQWIDHTAGSIAVVAPSLAPPSRVVAEREVRVNFNVPAACLLSGRQAYLFDAQTTQQCPDAPSGGLSADIQADPDCSSATPASAVISNVVSGKTYLVCIYVTDDHTKHSKAGTLTVVAPMTMTSTPEIVVVGLPVSFEFSGDSWGALTPAYFVALRGSDASVCSRFSSSDILGQGTIDQSTHITQTMTVPKGISALLICVSAQLPPQGESASALQGFTYGGTVATYPFTALTHYAALQRPNPLQGWPPTSDDNNLFLAPCSGTQCTVAYDNGPCQTSGPFYHTSATQVLDGGASIGTYLLCRTSTISNTVVGSNTTISVVSAWSLTLGGSNLHLFVPISATLQGTTPQARLRSRDALGQLTDEIPTTLEGPHVPHQAVMAATSFGAATWSSMELCVQDKNAGCAAVAAAGRCSGQSIPIQTGSNTITVTDLTLPSSVSFCLRPGPYDSFEMLQTTLQPYVNPGAIVIGSPTTLHTLSAGTAGATVQAKLSSHINCQDRVSKEAAAVVQQAVTLTLPNCVDATNGLKEVYYCETNGATSMSFSARGMLAILRPTSCGGNTPASIQPAVANPGDLITDFGIDTTVLTQPSVSRTSDCASAGTTPLTRYSPTLDEEAVLYVCAHALHDPTVIFTTTQPTLRVLKWDITPTAALSTAAGVPGIHGVSTTITSNYTMADTEAFLSTAQDCSVHTYSAGGLGTAQASFTYTTSGINSLLYACVHAEAAQSTSPLAVAAFLSVTPPSVTVQSPQILRGTTLHATLEVNGQIGQDPIYSMQPGIDNNWIYSKYFLSKSRQVFLARVDCTKPLTTPADVDASNQVRFETISFHQEYFTAGSTFLLCANTPAGVAEAMVLPAFPGNVYPTTFTSGAKDAPIYIPLVRSMPMWLVPIAEGAKSWDCTTSPSNPITFRTDDEGYANVTLIDPSTTQPLSPGTYAVCYLNSPHDLDPITVYPVEHFDIRGTVFILGIQSTVELLEDLTSDKLLSGFSTSRDCTSMSTQYGSWTTNSADSTQKTVLVTALTSKSGLYFCARAANGTLIALPPSPAAPVQFTTSVIFPNGNSLDTCAAIDINHCYGPGSTTALVDGVLEVVQGDCCASPSDPLRVVVGTASMRTGTCSLSLDPSKVTQPADYLYSICVRRTTDPSFCPTLNYVKIHTDCQDNIVNGRSKMAGWLIAVIVISIVLGLLLLALFIYLIWRFCCANRRKKQLAGKLNGQLVALRQMEMGDEDAYSFGTEANGGSMAGHMLRNGSLASNRHPLLYYPRPSQELQSGLHSQSIGNFARSVSQSQMVGSNGQGRYNTLVESIEDDERDQIALQEARERYHMRLHFNDELERLRVHEKEADLYNGEYVADDDEEDVLATNVRPELKRVVETIDVDPTETTVQAKDSTKHYDDDEDDEKAAAALTDSAVNGERRHVRSQSIESSRPSTPERRTSLKLQEDEILRRGTLESTPEHAVEVRSAGQRKSDTFNALSLDLAPTAAVAEGAAGRPLHNSSGEPQSEVNYTKIGKEASLTSSSSSVSQLVHMLNITPAGHKAAAPGSSAEAQAASDAAAAAAVKARPHARFEQPEAQMASGQPRNMQHAAEDDEDDEMNELSYTTTQRFYDETRFFIEQEDIRRQRLSNWEEEERAQLAEAELAGYMIAINSQIMPQAPGVNEAQPGNTSSDSSASTQHSSAGNHSGVGSVGSGHNKGDTTQTTTARSDKALYHAPHDPAAAPPPAARKHRSGSHSKANRASASGTW